MALFPADPVVDAVATRLLARASAGMERFGVSMEAENKPFDFWASEAIEEVLDAANYLEKARRVFQEQIRLAFERGRQYERDIIDEEEQNRYDARQHELFQARLR